MQIVLVFEILQWLVLYFMTIDSTHAIVVVEDC